MENAIRPSTMILMVSRVRKVLPFAVAPTVTPRNIVMIFISSFCAALAILSTTPDSLKRLPSISIPTSGAASGRKIEIKMTTITGKMIFSSLETGRSCSITTERSFLVVSAFIMGGWMIGTSAM